MAFLFFALPRGSLEKPHDTLKDSLVQLKLLLLDGCSRHVVFVNFLKSVSMR